MGARLDTSTVIERPISQVFAYVLNLQESFRAFDPAVESVDKTPDGPISTGTAFRLWQTVFGRRISAQVRYTAVQADREIAFVASAGPLSTTAVLSFAIDNRGTAVRFVGDAGPTGPFNLLSPLVQTVIGGVWAKRLRRLKRDLEAQPARVSGS